MIDIGPAQRAGAMEVWFHLRQLPKLARLHQRQQLSADRYRYLLQREQEYLTKVTLALAELVDTVGDEIANLKEGEG